MKGMGQKSRSKNPYTQKIKVQIVVKWEQTIIMYFTYGSELYCFYELNNKPIILQFNNLELQEDLMKKYSFMQSVRNKLEGRLMEIYDLDDEVDEFGFFEEWYEEESKEIKEMIDKTSHVAVKAVLLHSEKYLEAESDEEFIGEEDPYYNYFGINVAYGEEDRQMIDYLMANGDFDGALRIHQQYIDNKNEII